MKKRLSMLVLAAIVAVGSIFFGSVSNNSNNIAENPPDVFDPPFRISKKKPTPKTVMSKPSVVEVLKAV